MEKEVKRIAVLQAGKVLAILYAFMGLIMIPFMLLMMIPALMHGPEGLIAMIPMLAMVIAYPVMGFLGGIIGAAIYNLVAKWVGGFRFTVADTVVG
jgi:hypothetical protein